MKGWASFLSDKCSRLCCPLSSLCAPPLCLSLCVCVCVCVFRSLIPCCYFEIQTKDQIRAAKALKVASETRYSGDEPKTTLEPSKEVVARAMPPPPPRSAVTSNPAPAASYHADSQGTRYHDRGIASDSNLHSEPSVNKNVFSAIGASQQGGDARSVGASTGQVSSAGILHGGSTVIAQQGSSLGAVGNLPRRTISIEGSTGPVLAGGGGGDDQKEDVAVTSTLSTRVESWGDAVPGTAAAAMASNIDGVMDGSAAACSAISTAYAAEQNDGKAKILGASDQKMHGSRRKRAHPDAEEINDYEKPTNARKTSAGLPDDFFQQNQQSAVGAATTAGSWHAKGQENAEAEFETFMAEVGAADGAKDEPTKGANKDAGPAADVQTGGDEDGEDDRAAREDFEHL